MLSAGPDWMCLILNDALFAGDVHFSWNYFDRTGLTFVDRLLDVAVTIGHK